MNVYIYIYIYPLMIKKNYIWWFIIDFPLKSFLLLGDAPDSQTDLFINPTLARVCFREPFLCLATWWKLKKMKHGFVEKKRAKFSTNLNFNVEEMFPVPINHGKKHRAYPPVDQSEGQGLPPLLGFPEQYIYIYIIYIYIHIHP